MNTRKEIDAFYDSKRIALWGLSLRKKNFANMVLDVLRKRGYELYPINPRSDSGNVGIYSSAKELGFVPDAALIVLKPENSLAAVKEAVSCGIKTVWIQQTCASRASLEELKMHEISCITGKCVIMYLEDVSGVHKIHQSLWDLLGLTIKN